MRRLALILAVVALLASAAWFFLRPRASHDSRLAGAWQDRRIESMRQAAHDRGSVAGQGAWLVLETEGQGRQIDYNRVTLRTETPFRWRTEEKDGRRSFYRSYEAVGAGAGEAGRSGEVRYTWELSPDGKALTLKGDYGAATIYDRVPDLPDRVRQAPVKR